jgi:hypothetical protein
VRAAKRCLPAIVVQDNDLEDHRPRVGLNVTVAQQVSHACVVYDEVDAMEVVVIHLVGVQTEPLHEPPSWRPPHDLKEVMVRNSTLNDPIFNNILVSRILVADMSSAGSGDKELNGSTRAYALCTGGCESRGRVLRRGSVNEVY